MWSASRASWPKRRRDRVLMLEDEVELLSWAPRPMLNIRSSQPCSPFHCGGHKTVEETDAVHEAIESCYAALRD